MKNKNRFINILVIAFALIFLAGGAAFAFAPGVLDVTGTVNFATSCPAVWSNIEIGPSFGVTHHANIVRTQGRTNQRIEWIINFYDEGFAQITATVTNESALYAVTITDLTYGWADDGIAALFGLSGYIILTSLFVGQTISHGASATVTVSVAWNGTIPLGFEPSDIDVYTLINTFFIEFDYELAP